MIGTPVDAGGIHEMLRAPGTGVGVEVSGAAVTLVGASGFVPGTILLKTNQAEFPTAFRERTRIW